MSEQLKPCEREAFEHFCREVRKLSGPYLRDCNDPEPDREYQDFDTQYLYSLWNTRLTPDVECTHEATQQESHQAATYDETQSRNVFEAWAGKYCHLGRAQSGTYTSDHTQAKWEGWREREARRGLDSSAIDYSIKLQQILESVYYQRRETPHQHLHHGREIALFKANFNRTLFALKFGDGN